MTDAAWSWQCGDGPVLGTAIHAGHELRAEVAALSALSDVARRREEDPATEVWAAVAPTNVVIHRSRFEVDVNRPRERAVYLHPEECWGLQPWRYDPPPADVVDRSRRLYDGFYRELDEHCRRVARDHERFVVLDMHSYNHRRLGPGAPPADPHGNPEINVGTASADRRRWGALIDRFLDELNSAGFDTRENVRFTGAELAARIHRRHPEAGCCLAIDVKKVYMDEHTGEVDDGYVDRLRNALTAAVPGLVGGLRAAG